MKKMRLLTGTMAALVAVLGLAWVAVETSTRQRQPQARKLRLNDKISRVAFTPVSDVSFKVARDQPIHDWYVNEQGTIFAVLGDQEPGYLMKVVSPDGPPTSEFSCIGPAWGPRVHIWQITADEAGTIYAAVEWSWNRAGIIVVDSRGALVSKSEFTDFNPHTIAVDRERRVWVAGREIPLQPTASPDPEQIRVYDQSLKLLEIPVRSLTGAMFMSSLMAVENEVMYYAVGTNELYLFKDGKLVDKLMVGEIPKLPLPPEVEGKNVEVRRAIKGVWKLENQVVLGGFYTYHWNEQGVPWHTGRNFIVLINPEDSTISAELEAPRGSLTRSNLKGELVYLSSEGGQGSASKFIRMRIAF
jgi:hypothetical protein